MYPVACAENREPRACRNWPAIRLHGYVYGIASAKIEFIVRAAYDGAAFFKGAGAYKALPYHRVHGKFFCGRGLFLRLRLGLYRFSLGVLCDWRGLGLGLYNWSGLRLKHDHPFLLKHGYRQFFMIRRGRGNNGICRCRRLPWHCGYDLYTVWRNPHLVPRINKVWILYMRVLFPYGGPFERIFKKPP